MSGGSVHDHTIEKISKYKIFSKFRVLHEIENHTDFWLDPTDIFDTMKCIMMPNVTTKVSAAHMNGFFGIMSFFREIQRDASWGGPSAGGLRYI